MKQSITIDKNVFNPGEWHEVDNVTIFYNDALWASKDGRIFDTRVDSQIIPSGSVIIGYMTAHGNGVVVPPGTIFQMEEQMEDFKMQVIYAMSILRLVNYSLIETLNGDWVLERI